MNVVSALKSSGIDLIDAEILLSKVIGRNRTWILTHPEEEMDPKHAAQFSDYCAQRKSGKPVAYITHEKEFFGRTFAVDEHVLIPRPATELLVEQVLRVMRHQQWDDIVNIDSHIVAYTDVWNNIEPTTLVDVGTGSGCIAVTLSLELPNVTIIATDTSIDALNIAKNNATKLHLHSTITFLHGKNLEPLANMTEPFLLVSNPPYISDETKLMKDVASFEPHQALFAGEEGTDVLDCIIQEARSHPYCIGFVLECTEKQATKYSRPT